MGLLRDIIWVKPPWTNQIPEGRHELVFGWKTEIDSNSNEMMEKMAIATDLDYWVGDGNSVQNSDLLSHRSKLDLRVMELKMFREGATSQASADVVMCGKKRKSASNIKTGGFLFEQEWILDICLDYFSCANPLQEPDLPEHESTEEEIKCMLGDLRSVLQELLKEGLCIPPALCIIARSEHDGFTPGCVAPMLESAVLKVLDEVYGELRILQVPTFEMFYNPTFIRTV